MDGPYQDAFGNGVRDVGEDAKDVDIVVHHLGGGRADVRVGLGFVELVSVFVELLRRKWQDVDAQRGRRLRRIECRRVGSTLQECSRDEAGPSGLRTSTTRVDLSGGSRSAE